MRWSLVALAAVFVPTVALAKPKLAVAPLDGDKDGAISDVVAEEAAEHGKTTKPERVQKEIEKLDISSMSAKSVKKLRLKLDVDVVIHGKVDKDGGKKHLALVLNGSGKAKSGLEVDFRTTKDLKKVLAKKLGRQIEAASSGGADTNDDGDDDEEKHASPLRGHNDDDTKSRDDDDKKSRDDDDRKKSRDDDDRKKSRDDDKKSRDEDDKKARDDDDRKKSRDEDDRKKSRDEDKKSRDDDRKKSRDDDDDKKSHKRTASRDDDEEVRKSDDDDEDTGRHHKKRHHRHDDDESSRHPLTQAAAWVDAGAGFARRTLTYQATGNMQPPGVGTAAPAAQVEGELYPGSFSTLKGPAAGLGIAGAFDRELALGIAVPKTTVVAPIKSGYYWIGARYRFSFGGSSIAVGASYWRRTYMADRSKLMMPTQLDMPDVDYTAVAPDVTGRFAASPKLGVFASVQVPLMLDSGPIQDKKSYGPSVIKAFDVRSGVQYAFGDHYALQVALAFDQITLKFGAKLGTMAADRSVSAATDRSIGLAATFGIMY